MMKASSHSVINAPVDRIDLAAWLQIFSDRDYQACSPGHRAAGCFREKDQFGTINVENVGGHLLVHHYLADVFTAPRVVLWSRDTRVYLLHLWPATIDVCWIMDVQAGDGETTVFTCTVEVRTSPVLSALARLCLLPTFLRRHVVGETPLFAADIARKIREARL